MLTNAGKSVADDLRRLPTWYLRRTLHAVKQHVSNAPFLAQQAADVKLGQIVRVVGTSRHQHARTTTHDCICETSKHLDSPGCGMLDESALA